MQTKSARTKKKITITDQKKVIGDVTHTLSILRDATAKIAFDSVNLTIQSVTVNKSPAKFESTATKLIVPLPAAAYQLAEGIARKYTPHLGTRTLDVLHVAGALALKARAFYTFDNKQAKLAFTLGLRIL